MKIRERKLNRLRNYDYRRPGYYFVTICTKGRINYFGNVVDNKMVINPMGNIIESCWLDLPNHYINCRLDEYVIMSNHVHGIIAIPDVGNGLKPFPPLHGLSEFIRAFKTFSSRRINQMDSSKKFQWQKSFHDHIIRDDWDLNRVRRYIRYNPTEWDNDRNNIHEVN